MFFLHWYPCDGNLAFSWFVEEMAKTMWWSRGLCLLIGIGTRCACLKQAAKKGLQVASFSFERNTANLGCRYILLWEHLWWQSSQMAFAWAATPVGQIFLFRWSLYYQKTYLRAFVSMRGKWKTFSFDVLGITAIFHFACLRLRTAPIWKLIRFCMAQGAHFVWKMQSPYC